MCASKNRRIKAIHLTYKGKEYTNTLVLEISGADIYEMSALSADEQETLIKHINK